MIPRYVQNDLIILDNLEFNNPNYRRLSYKLWRIAENYPQKNLYVVLEHMGYFFEDKHEIKEDEYRDAVKSISKDFFISAMNTNEVYEDVHKQEVFMKIGFIDSIFKSRESFIKNFF